MVEADQRSGWVWSIMGESQGVGESRARFARLGRGRAVFEGSPSRWNRGVRLILKGKAARPGRSVDRRFGRTSSSERTKSMPRSNLLPLVALWAAGVVGCAHCDICDDFPAPCNGPGCYTGGAAGAPMPVTNTAASMPGPVSSANSSGTAMPPPPVDLPPPAGVDAGAQPSPPPADAGVEAPK